TVTRSMKRPWTRRNGGGAYRPEYNEIMHISPETVRSQIKDILSSIYEADYFTVPLAAEEAAPYDLSEDKLRGLEEEMRDAAKRLDFERAAEIRDRIKELKSRMLTMGIK
ncbi:MAG: UvrB/UvrC motif-containing protein, partial [Desulfomicrobium escambiense]|nr:UvrB/UvrC motif-containing protein [Desulfomicrobium escambiense]